MEYLEGWELVHDQDDHDDGGREKIRSTNCLSSSSSSLEGLDNSAMEKKKDEDDYQYSVSAEFVDMESAAKALKEKDEQPQPQPQRGGFDIWKWRLTGIGALCSFGMATACVLVFGEAPKGKKNSLSLSLSHRCFNLKGYEQNQRLVAAVRGGRGSLHVPFTTAHITFGGYVYDAHLST